MKYRLLSVAACLALLHGAASAQEAGGLLGMDRPRYGLAPAVMNVPSPEALRDSLAFAANVKSFVPRAARLPRWRRADSLAVPTADYRSLGSITPASAMPQFGHNPYAFDFNRSGVLTLWRGGAVVGSAFRQTMPALMSRQNASVGVVQNVGNLTLTGSLSADHWSLKR